MSTALPATADVPLPEPDGVVKAMWNVVRHGPNYDGRQKDVIAAAKAYAERHAAAVSAAKDAEIERLRAEVAGLREDAERYRWLRDECPWMMVSGNGKSNLSIRVRAEFDLGDLVDMVDEFDAAIDAARKGEAC